MKIGIDLGGSHVAVGIVTQEGKLLTKQERNISFVEQEDEKIQKTIRDNIVSLISIVLKEIQKPISEIEKIGIGIPGIVEENKIKKCNKLRIKDWDLAIELEKHYKIPVKVQNDALCAAIAEKKYGSLKEAKKAIFLCLGTGIGGATIIEQQIIPSEYGHMIIRKEGRECDCGNKGCFQTYCSMKILKKEVISLLALNSNTTSEELITILRKEKQNENLKDYLDEFVDTFIIGLSNIINILSPDKICLGGSFVYYEDIVYKRLLERINLHSCQFKIPEIVLAEFGNNAGIIGAACI